MVEEALTVYFLRDLVDLLLAENKALREYIELRACGADNSPPPRDPLIEAAARHREKGHAL